jgi:FkbM family methyltransferase
MIWRRRADRLGVTLGGLQSQYPGNFLLSARSAENDSLFVANHCLDVDGLGRRRWPLLCARAALMQALAMNRAGDLRQWAGRAVLALLRKTRHAWRVNFTIHTSIGRRRFAVPIVFGCGVADGATRETWLNDILRRCFERRAGAFVDVGANLGQTLLKVRALDPDRPYYGFEPHPFCCHYLRELVARNALRACAIVPVALADRVTVTPLLSTGATDTWATIVDGFRPSARYSRADPVPVFDGDSVLRQLAAPPVACIKIDAEGAELDVLRGLQQTIARDRPYILCEILPVHNPATPQGALRLSRQDQLFEFITSHGYRLYRVSTNRPTPITAIGIHDDVSMSNYVLVPDAEPDWPVE